MSGGRRAALEAVITGWRPKSKQYGPNCRLQHFARAGRAKQAKQRTENALTAAQWPRVLPGPRCMVTFTVEQARGGALQDSDNLAGCLKAPRDLVAKWFGVGDGPADPIEWFYVATRGPVDRVLMTVEVA